jgi:hypothetical protein
MNHKQTLIAAAAAKRDAAIKKATLQYRRDVREIRAANRPAGYEYDQRKAVNDSLRDFTAIGAAETILRERNKPTFMVDIVIEIQSRGCRTSDDPRAVMASIGSSFRYHPDKFIQDAEGRWSIQATKDMIEATGNDG